MRNFKDSEFNFIDRMDPEFLLFLDDVRDEAGVPFFLTSDARDWRANHRAGGVSTSLHLYVPSEERFASAVDFATPMSRQRNIVGWREECYKIARAVVVVAEALRERNRILTEKYAGRAVQLEFVQGPTDWHVHLGLQPEGSPIKSKLILKLD